MKRQRGLSWIELAVCLAVIAGFAAILLDRLADYQEDAERAEMELVLAHIRAGLRLEMARRISRGESLDATPFLGANPLHWLETPPRGYLGEDAPPAAPPGAWYFRPQAGELVYVARRHRHLEGATGDPPRLRWQFRPALSEPGIGTALEPVLLVPVEPYRWFESPQP